jgi:hypothetical protein
VVDGPVPLVVYVVQYEEDEPPKVVVMPLAQTQEGDLPQREVVHVSLCQCVGLAEVLVQAGKKQP